MLLDLSPQGIVQGDLWASAEAPDLLMETRDEVNATMGRQSVTFVGTLSTAGWNMRQDNLSPRYTTY